jgi:hypothetical protein
MFFYLYHIYQFVLIKIKSEDDIQLLWFFINIVFCFSVFSGVRLDRVRGGRQKYKRSPDSQPIIQHILCAQ